MHWNTEIIAEAEELVKRFVQNNFCSYLKSTAKKARESHPHIEKKDAKKYSFYAEKPQKCLTKIHQRGIITKIGQKEMGAAQQDVAGSVVMRQGVLLVPVERGKNAV